MGTLKLRTSFSQDMTMISNTFLDIYMPRANGEFVKVYLLMLRISTKKGETLTLSSLADLLNCTENDIYRAIRYWEKEGLLLIETDGNGEVTGIMMTALTPAELPENSAAQNTSVLIETESAPTRSAEEPVRGRISPERTAELIEKEEIVELNFIAEQYLGKPLTSSDIQKLLYFYDELHFTTDLISYLIEYCVGNDHKSMRYIEKVAYNWYEEGIRTVHDARSAVNNFNRDYYEVLKSFGISGRNPAPAEITYMKKWFGTYALPLEVIKEACGRTILGTGKASFSYADGILKAWSAAGVRSLDDVRALDEKRDLTGPVKRSVNPPAKKKTAFDYQDQRTYNYTELEKKLLKGDA